MKIIENFTPISILEIVYLAEFTAYDDELMQELVLT